MVHPSPSPHPALPAPLLALYGQRLAYAEINADLTAAFVSDNIGRVCPGLPLPWELPLPQWELFLGLDGMLADMQHGRLPEYIIEEVNVVGNDEQVIYLTFGLYPLATAAMPHGLLLTIENVTPVSQLKQKLVQERNQLRLAKLALAEANAELKNLNELKSLFLAFAVHDLRTPLTAIRGYSDILQRHLKNSDERTTKSLAIIASQSELLERLVHDVLDVEAIRQGKLSIHPQRQDLAAVLSYALPALNPLVAIKQITLTYQPPAEPLWCAVDAARVHQIMHNLVRNSARFTPAEGQIEITAVPEGEWAHITVRDTGIGIPAAQLPYVFQLFYEATAKANTGGRGTGIGLYIVQMLVQLHHGRVNIESEEGAGTTIHLWLPCDYQE